MRFQIPQFLERETKIFGPLTFRQFIYIGVAGAIIFVLYFTLAQANLMLFLVITIFLAGGAVILAFVQIGGKSLISVLGNVLTYSFSSRIYLWKRKSATPKLIKMKRAIKKKVEEGPILKISNKGRLEKLSTKIEIKTK